MSLVLWNRNIETGYADIDGDHREIISQLNSLHDALKSGQDTDAELSQAMMSLSDYVGRHFAREEALMQQHNYPDSAYHSAQHKVFCDRLNELLSRWEQGDADQAPQLIKLLTDWFVNHIKVVDMAFVAEIR